MNSNCNCLFPFVRKIFLFQNAFEKVLIFQFSHGNGDSIISMNLIWIQIPNTLSNLINTNIKRRNS